MRSILVMVLAASAGRGGEYADKFTVLVATLNASQPESACKARAALRDWFPKAAAGDTAPMFRAFRTLVVDIDRGSTNDFEEGAAARPVAEALFELAGQAGSSKGAGTGRGTQSGS